VDGFVTQASEKPAQYRSPAGLLEHLVGKSE
jgi:hypothetical protein